MTCDCKRHPGKFEGEPASTVILYEATLAGCSDEDCGAYSLFQAPILPDPKEPIDDELRTRLVDEGYCQECIEAGITELQEAAGAITHQSEQGFETHESHNHLPRLLEAWDNIVEDEPSDE